MLGFELKRINMGSLQGHGEVWWN